MSKTLPVNVSNAMINVKVKHVLVRLVRVSVMQTPAKMVLELILKIMLILVILVMLIVIFVKQLVLDNAMMMVANPDFL
jgi:hypothetical protein